MAVHDTNPDYTSIDQSQFDAVLDVIANGNSIAKACLKCSVGVKSFYEFKRAHKEIAENDLARSLEQRAALRVDQMEETELACMEEVRTIDDPKRANAIVQAYKLKLDRIKWQAAKEAVKFYGEKIEHTGDVNLGVINFPVRAKENSNQ